MSASISPQPLREVRGGLAPTLRTLRAPAMAPLAVHPGPVPDYAPIASIQTHESLAKRAPELSAALERILGERHQVAHFRWHDFDPQPEDSHDQDVSVLWMRDYQPLFVRRTDGGLRALYYLSHNTNRSVYRHEDLPSGVEVRQLAIMHENGNLVTTGRHVFFSETMFANNCDDPALTSHLRGQGYTPRSRNEVMALLENALERPTSDFVVMPKMPFEPTGHIDSYLLPLGPDLVLVPSIEAEALALLDAQRLSHSAARAVQAFLDAQATRLTRLGLRVVRLPMLAPELRLPPNCDVSELTSDDVELLVYTPANSLLANLGHARHVFVPSFLNGVEQPGSLRVAVGYQQRWADMFHSLGWEPHFVDASALVGYLGLLRCVSATIPR